jgi:hypothetical protein
VGADSCDSDRGGHNFLVSRRGQKGFAPDRITIKITSMLRLQKLRDQGSGTISTGKFFMSAGSETRRPVIPR